MDCAKQDYLNKSTPREPAGHVKHLGDEYSVGLTTIIFLELVKVSQGSFAADDLYNLSGCFREITTYSRW